MLAPVIHQLLAHLPLNIADSYFKDIDRHELYILGGNSQHRLGIKKLQAPPVKIGFGLPNLKWYYCVYIYMFLADTLTVLIPYIFILVLLQNQTHNPRVASTIIYQLSYTGQHWAINVKHFSMLLPSWKGRSKPDCFQMESVVCGGVTPLLQTPEPFGVNCTEQEVGDLYKLLRTLCGTISIS